MKKEKYNPKARHVDHKQIAQTLISITKDANEQTQNC